MGVGFMNLILKVICWSEKLLFSLNVGFELEKVVLPIF